MYGRLVAASLCAIALAGCTTPNEQMSAKVDAQAKQIAEAQASLKLLRTEVANRGGRFQVMNGTPQFARNIMIIDTQTGRAWIMCETKDASSMTNTNWCAMEFNGLALEPK